MIDKIFIITHILIPLMGSGIIFGGFFLALYVYFYWRNKLYLSMAVICLISFCFISSEGLISIFTYMFNNPVIGRELHRLEQIFALYYLFGIPILFTYYLNLKKTFKKINIIIGFIGLWFAITSTFIAFINSDLFISISKFAARSLGRGQDGILYSIRDIYLGLLIIYYFIVIITQITKRNIFKQALYVFFGIIIALFGALDDTIFIHFGIHIGLFPSQDYSRFIYGIIIFTLLSMLGLSKSFIEQSKKVAIAYEELDKSKEKLSYVSYYDQLTGLMNRKAFYERMEDSLTQAKRGDTFKMRGLLLIDLDNFKDINDAIGYEFGDEILKEVTARIKNALRESDYFFRFGGDEFIIILNSVIDDTDAAIVSNRIIDNISNPFNIKNNKFYLGISIGISLFPQDGLDINTLVKNADTALNEAKKESNIFKYFTKSMEIKAVKKVAMISEIRSGMEKNEFELYYQPIQNFYNKVIGAEALIRWNHPEKGIISPLSFIPVAEDSMLIIPLGQWILEKACNDLKKIHALGFNDIFFSVNLSIKQFKESSFVENIKSIIKKTEIDPKFIHLEITESCLMKDTTETIGKLNSLRDIGMKFAIDDFGTGYSSFSYLEILPINTVKIEKCFIAPIPDEKKKSPLVEAIILLAKKLGLEVITEGVETEKQIEYLKELDPEIIIQGYYYSKPLKLADFIEYLNNHQPLKK